MFSQIKFNKLKTKLPVIASINNDFFTNKKPHRVYHSGNKHGNPHGNTYGNTYGK